MKILIIDDYPELRESLQNEIEEVFPWANVIALSSGNEAVKMLNSGESFDFVVTDYEIPQGNGLLVLDHVSKMKLETKIVIFSSSIALAHLLPEGNFLGVIDKPNIKFLITMLKVHSKKCG